jgi:hypothetical protein
MRQTAAEYCRQRRREWKKLGICGYCGKRDAMPGRTRCGYCAEYQQEYKERRAAQKKEAANGG